MEFILPMINIIIINSDFLAICEMTLASGYNAFFEATKFR